MPRANVLKFLRQMHLYTGIFISPALLFFALSGALQLFNLHEPAGWHGSKPPAWMETLGTLHKNQKLPGEKRPGPGKAQENAVPRRREDSDEKSPGSGSAARPAASPAAPAVPAPAPAPSAPARKHNALPLKLFFLLVSVSLVVSTLSGIYMAWKYNRDKRVTAALLVAGAVVPVLLLLAF